MLVGMQTQNLTICLLTLLFFEGLINSHNNRKVILICVVFVCLIIGVSISSFSPGSRFRISGYAHSFETNPYKYFEFFYQISKYFLKASRVLIVFSIFSAISIFTNLDLKIAHQMNYNGESKFKWFLNSSKWLFVAFSSILTLILVPEAASLRTSLYFMIFLFLFIMLITFKFLDKFKKRIDLKRYLKLINICLVIFLVSHLGYMLYCYKIGEEYQSFMRKTNAYLLTQTHTNDTITIKNKSLSHYPFMYNIKKNWLTEDPNNEINYVNREWEYYYDIGLIRGE